MTLTQFLHRCTYGENRASGVKRLPLCLRVNNLLVFGTMATLLDTAIWKGKDTQLPAELHDKRLVRNSV